MELVRLREAITPLRLGAGGAALALALTTFVATSPGPPAAELATAPTPVPETAPLASVTVPRVVTEAVADEVPAGLEVDLRERPELPPADVEVEPDDALPSFEAPEPVELPEEVDTVSADVLVRAAPETLESAEVQAVFDEASHLAAVGALRADGVGPTDEERTLDLLAVDPISFRPLTPDVTADAVAVWERLVDGDVLVAHEVAESLDLELGGELLLRAGDADPVPVRVGAFAANGAPPLADVLVPPALAEQLAVEVTDAVVLSVGDAAEDVTDQLEELVAGVGDVQLLRDPEPAIPQPQQQAARGQLEPFQYTSHADGRITIHGDWVARNIVGVQLPGMAATQCHRVMVPQLMAAVEELIALDLYDHLDPSQFAGCFVARHIDWNPARPLSMHAWGLAIDFNTRDNPLGARPVMDPRVVAVFERWGFDWGGYWRRPDGMHFELARIVTPG